MSRARVLDRVRKALGVEEDGDPARREAAAMRIAKPIRHLTPARVSLERPELIQLFMANMRQQSAELLEVPNADVLPGSITRHLASAGVSGRFRLADDPFVRGLQWDRDQGFEYARGRAVHGDQAALSVAIAAVAETGTLVLASGPDNPTTLAFLPETHVVAVREDAIVAAFEDAIAIVRERYGRGQMPRSLNFISAPSRTGDIGGQIVLGAHGPRRLVVAIVKSS